MSATTTSAAAGAIAAELREMGYGPDDEVVAVDDLAHAAEQSGYDWTTAEDGFEVLETAAAMAVRA